MVIILNLKFLNVEFIKVYFSSTCSCWSEPFLLKQLLMVFPEADTCLTRLQDFLHLCHDLMKVLLA